MTEENLINLKEAAQISGYTSDYVGQLIRSGKIQGKQVYTGIAWMTTAKAVLDYKNKSKNEEPGKSRLKDIFLRTKLKLRLEIDIIKLFAANSRSILPIFIILIISLFFLISFTFYQIINSDQKIEGNIKPAEPETLSY